MSPIAVVIVMVCYARAERHQCPVEAEMEEWLVDNIARSYWDLTTEQGKPFGRLMQKDAALKKRVLRRLAQLEFEGSKGSGSEEGSESE